MTMRWPLFVKYYRMILLFDNRAEFEDFLAMVPDCEKVFEPKFAEHPQIFIAGILLPKAREDTPEDAYEASKKVREWAERFLQAQDQDTSSIAKGGDRDGQ